MDAIDEIDKLLTHTKNKMERAAELGNPYQDSDSELYKAQENLECFHERVHDHLRKVEEKIINEGR